MSKKENEVSRAEQYRQERKERLAKAAKTSGKKTIIAKPVNKKRNRIMSIAITVIAVLLIAVWLVFFFGVPQRMSTAITVNGESVSQAEYTYYYMSAYQRQSQMSSYMAQYGLGTNTDFDTTKSPMNQEYKGTEEIGTKDEGATYTWADYFDKQATDLLSEQIMLGQKAKEAGISLDDTEKADIQGQIDDLRDSAKEQDFALNAYLSQVFGKGVNEKILRTALERQALADKYKEAKVAELGEKMTAEEVEKAYTENKDTYDVVDLRVRSFKVDTSGVASDASEDEKKAATTKAQNEAKAKADALFAKVTDEKSFIQAVKDTAAETEKSTYEDDDATLLRYATNSTMKSSFGDDVAKWAIDAARKSGDKTVITSDSAVYVVYIVKPRYLETDGTRTVRHVLFKYADSATDAQKKETLAKAEEALASFNKGDKTEAAFAELARTKSEDTGSQSAGGLITDMQRGKMVAPFENWSFDQARKAGDTGIVESTYGAHVMYFVSKAETPVYEQTIRSEKGTKEYDTALEEMKKNDMKVEKKESTVLSIQNSTDKRIRTMIARSSASNNA